MFVAQYYGKGDYTGISQVFSLVTKICGCIAVVFLAGTLFFPEQLMRILTNEETLIVLGSEYLRVIGISYVFSGIAQIFLAIMKNCGAVNMSTLINGVMVILNIALNAVFIFGLSGFPKMGIKGAAIGTLTARRCCTGNRTCNSCAVPVECWLCIVQDQSCKIQSQKL